MSLRADTGKGPQEAFADWVSDALAAIKQRRGWGLRRVARESGISHTQIYSWMGQPESAGYVTPKPHSLRQFCDRLGLPWDEPFRILGWNTTTPGDRAEPEEIQGHMDFLHELLTDPDNTPDEEARYQAMMDSLRIMRDESLRRRREREAGERKTG